MKKRKIKNYFKKGILLIGFLVSLTNCEQEETIVQKDSVYKTVSKLEVLDLLNSYEKNKTSNRIGSSIDLKYDINLLKYESIINSNEFLAVIPANTIHNSVNSRILLIKENNDIHAVLFNMFSSELKASNSFSGIIQITDLDGNFINGYRVKEGKFISQFFKEQLSKKGNKFSKTTSIDCGCGNGEFCLIWTQNLNEITINANSSSVTSPVSIGGLLNNNNTPTIDEETEVWDWEGGGNLPPISPIDCETGYTKDIYGNCVKKPCIGDSFVNMEISNFNSGKNANRFGCVRKDPNKICNNIIGDRYHAGIDLKAEIGTIIVSITEGQVYATGTSPTFGNYIIIKNDNLFFLYAHLYEVPVTSGAIKTGQQIAISGESATVGEPHLHLEVRERMANENYNDMKNLNIENYLKTKFDNNGNTINNNC